jgi:hypothetical protein
MKDWQFGKRVRPWPPRRQFSGTDATSGVSRQSADVLAKMPVETFAADCLDDAASL